MIRRYNEDRHYEEESIDIDSGEVNPTSEDVEKKKSATRAELIKWLDNHQGSKLFKENRPSELRALKEIAKNHKDPYMIRDRAIELHAARKRNISFWDVKRDLAINPPK